MTTANSDAPRIIIIEDDRTIGMTTQAYLQSEGYAVEWCRDGESGAQAVLANPPDVILLDLLMPTRDGFSVLELLGERGLTDRTVIVTALTHEEARQHAEKHGTAGYITKPVRYQMLVEKIVEVLARGGQGDIDRLVAGSG